MKMTAREKHFIQWGAVAAAVIVAYLLILNPIRRKWAESRDFYRTERTAFLALRKNVSARVQLDRSIQNLEKKLAVKRQKGPVDEQRQAFVKNIEQTAGRTNTKITGINPRTAPGQRKQAAPTAGTRIAYTLSAETDQGGMLRFLKALDDLENPVVITDFDAKNDSRDSNKILISLDFYTYLFDESEL